MSMLLLATLASCLAAAEAFCPPLPLLQNGHYDAIPKARNKVRIICDPSYEYIHPAYPSRRLIISTCRNGNWDDPAPQCHPLSDICMPPTAPENGRFIGAEPFAPGTAVHFYCDEGYYRKGPDQLTCRGYDFEWDGYPPICIKYDPTSITDIAEHLNRQFVDKMEQFSLGRAIEHDVEREGLDLMLVFDKSSSIPPDQFDEGIKFAKFFISKFNISNGGKDIVGGTRLSVFTFGTNLKKEINFDDATISSTQLAIQRLSRIRCGEQCDGGTNMVEALRAANYDVEAKARPRAKKALFMTSDGLPTYEPGQKPVTHYTDQLKKKDVEIFTVGIGNDINEKFLSGLASSPPEEHVFLLKNFEDFSKIVTIIREKAVKPPPPTPDKCGYIAKNHQQNNTGIEDKNIMPGQWPWLAAIIVEDPSTNGTRYACDGVLICSRWVLTNAQCLFDKHRSKLSPGKVFVVVGNTNLVEPSAHEQHFYAVDIIVHDFFNISARKMQADIALIKLHDNVAFNDHVRPACIMDDSSIIDPSYRPEAKGIMVGWLLQKEEDARLVDQPITTIQASQARLEVSAIDLCNVQKPKNYNCESSDTFHASGREASDRKCSGINMGSPFLMMMNDRYHVAGIASHVEGCSVSRKSVMFARVHPFADWILIMSNFCASDHL